MKHYWTKYNLNGLFAFSIEFLISFPHFVTNSKGKTDTESIGKKIQSTVHCIWEKRSSSYPSALLLTTVCSLPIMVRATGLALSTFFPVCSLASLLGVKEKDGKGDRKERRPLWCVGCTLYNKYLTPWYPIKSAFPGSSALLGCGQQIRESSPHSSLFLLQPWRSE